MTATAQAVAWPTGATSSRVSPLKMRPPKTSRARSAAAAALASDDPYRIATTIAETTT